MRRTILILIALIAAPLVAEHVRTEVQNVPVDRLVANLQQQMKARPNDMELKINLARVYSMAYAQKVDHIVVRGKDPSEWKPAFTAGADIAYQQFDVNEAADAGARAAAKVSLEKAISAYREALKQDPGNVVGLIGLGWCLVQAGKKSEAIGVLRKAVDAAWVLESRPDASIYAAAPSMVAEAASYLSPLLDLRRDAREIGQLQDRIKKVDELPRWITPIVIPLRAGLSAQDIVDDDARVVFDLDGTGPKRWTWVTSEAAWLVFDRMAEGRITSGLQLFGSVTFWAFWQNGYHALRALDDDGSGEVRGAELRGLALWHDRNRNGVSEFGEVRPLAAWGITALSTAYRFDASHPHEIPWSSAGVRFADGTVRPTWDVVLRRVP